MEEQVVTAPQVSRLRRTIVAVTAVLGLAVGAAALSATAATAADIGSEDATSVEDSSGSSDASALQAQDDDGTTADDCPERDSEAGDDASTSDTA